MCATTAQLIFNIFYKLIVHLQFSLEKKFNSNIYNIHVLNYASLLLSSLYILDRSLLKIQSQRPENGARDCSVAKNISCSSRGLEFGYKYSYWVFHNHLLTLALENSGSLLVSEKYPHTCGTHKKNFLNIKIFLVSFFFFFGDRVSLCRPG